MKYIVLKTEDGEIPVLFPKSLYHDQVAEKLGWPSDVVSAGKVRLRDGEIACYGESTGLKIESRPETDSALIEDLL